jgi:hypothetical protein
MQADSLARAHGAGSYAYPAPVPDPAPPPSGRTHGRRQAFQVNGTPDLYYGNGTS